MTSTAHTAPSAPNASNVASTELIASEVIAIESGANQLASSQLASNQLASNQPASNQSAPGDADLSDLDARKAKILKAVVEGYIETGQPVGSQQVVAGQGLGVSPATVRNDMSALEQLGYLTHPHTSAGRIPTDRGYRFFVDSLSQPAPLAEPKAARIADFFNQAHGELEQMLHETSRLLSGLTDHAAVVIGPPHEVATIKSVQLVGLGTHHRDDRLVQLALLVCVLSNGAIEKRTLELDPATHESHLSAATTSLASAIVGRPMSSLSVVPPVLGGPDPLVVTAAKKAVGALVPSAPEGEAREVFVGGAARMASAFDAIDVVRKVLTVLEQHYVVVSLLREALSRSGNVSIGGEHANDASLEPLQSCSVVVAPYHVDGQRMGSIGVLGPTRMNYPQAMAAVAEVGQRLSQRLADG